MSTENPVLVIRGGGRFGKPSGPPLIGATTEVPMGLTGLTLGGGSLHFLPFERLDISLITLSPQGKSIRPGGSATKPKPFALHSQRQIRYKKVGIRRLYSIKQLVSVRDAYKKFPLGIDPIANVFDEGIGTEIGRQKSEDISVVVEEQNMQEGPKLSERSTGQRRFRSSKKDMSRSGETSEGAPSSMQTLSASATPSETPLKKKKRAWVPPSLRVKHGGMLDPLEVFERSIRSILNKITLDTFDDLAPRVVTFFEEEVTNAAGLYKLVSLIFEKTLQEPLFGPLYAGVCVQLSQREKKLTITEKKDDGSAVDKQLGFKQALLKQCQREFEKGKRDVLIKPEMKPQDIEEAQMKQKSILLGTIQFIGQLYLHDLLTNKIIKMCIIQLLNQDASEEDIECVCELLRNVGQKLDETVPEIGVYYRRLQNIAKDKDGYHIRIRFMARNLLELRERGWTDDLKKSVLRKKQDIREEFEQQKGGRKRPPISTFDESDPSQIAAVMDSDADIGIKFGIKKFDIDVIGVDVTATEKLRHEPSLSMNYHARYKKPRETREAPEQKSGMRANRKERHRNFLLASQNVSVSVVVPARQRRLPAEPAYDRPGMDVQFQDEEEKEGFQTKVMAFYTNYVMTASTSLKDTLGLIRKIGAMDRPFLARLYFDTTSQSMGENRERGSRLIFSLLDEGLISAREFSEGVSEVFEFIVDGVLDCPNLFNNCAYILAQLFDDGIVHMDQLHVWLSKDESLSKWYKRMFDRNPQEMQRKSEEASHSFTKRDQFVAKVIAELGELNGDRSKDEIVSIMTQQRFDLSVYVRQERRNSFIREFDLQQWFG